MLELARKLDKLYTVNASTYHSCENPLSVYRETAAKSQESPWRDGSPNWFTNGFGLFMLTHPPTVKAVL